MLGGADWHGAAGGAGAAVLRNPHSKALSSEANHVLSQLINSLSFIFLSCLIFSCAVPGLSASQVLGGLVMGGGGGMWLSTGATPSG